MAGRPVDFLVVMFVPLSGGTRTMTAVLDEVVTVIERVDARRTARLSLPLALP